MTNIFERFRKKWSRIEKTMKGHISGRRIWCVDEEDEDAYVFLDNTLEQFLKQELLTIIEGTIEEEEELFEDYLDCPDLEQQESDKITAEINQKRTELIQFYKEQGYQELLDELNIK